MKLRPARTQAEAERPISVIADLDALTQEKVGFKFHGKIHVLNPVTAEQLMEMELARVKLVTMLNARAEGLVLSSDEIYQRYFDVVHPIAPTLTYAEIKSMDVMTLNSILTLVMRQLTGDPTLYQKKKEIS
jgi:hypothetical protein